MKINKVVNFLVVAIFCCFMIGISLVNAVEAKSDSDNTMTQISSVDTAAKRPTERRSLGGVNLSAYCKSLGYTKATLVHHNVYGWRCYKHQGQGLWAGLSVTQACKKKYGFDDAYAQYLDFNNPYSWVCYV